MKIVSNAPRNLRSFLRRTVADRKLYIVNTRRSRTTKSTAHLKCWRYAIPYEGELILVGKPVASRDTAKTEAVNRFGVKAIVYSPKKRKAA